MNPTPPREAANPSAFRSLFVERSGRPAVHLLRGTLSSGVAFSVDFGILVFLTDAAGVHYLASAAAGFAVGTTVSYILSVLWVFEKRRFGDTRVEFGLFILIGASGVALNELLIWVFTEHAHTHYMLSKIMAGSSIFFYNFFTRKRVLFR
jgi:putative flippase GtrA